MTDLKAKFGDRLRIDVYLDTYNYAIKIDTVS